tara:strand:+ start:283 stop:729 length:447 start_codon:yes stop_codon:yes gene_type:complete
MNKIFFLFFFVLISCGYKPLYTNKNLDKFTFNKIELKGNKDINRRIISQLNIKQNSSNFNFENLLLTNTKEIVAISKNSKGQIELFKMNLIVDLEIKDQNKVVKKKNFQKEFSYKNLDNKFSLSEYEIDIENNLINEILEDITLYLNI